MSISQIKKPQMVEVIHEYVSSALKREMETEFEKAKTELMQTLDKRKDEIVSGILLHTMSMVDIQSYSDRLVFTIKKIENK